MNNTLNIAIDARVLAHPHCGIGRYATSVVRELAEQQSTHRVYLYSYRRLDLGFPLPERWKMRASTAPVRGMSTAFAQSFFPVWAALDQIDVFWSPVPKLPLLLPPRVRKLMTVHDMVWKRFPQTMTRASRLFETALMPMALRAADHVIADSKFTRSEIIEFFPGARDKVDVVYLASNLRDNEPTFPSPISSPYFLFVGSNEPRKNLERMLLAYVQYRKSVPHPFDLVIAGSDQWGNFNLADFVRTNDLQSYVHLIRGVNDNVLSALYSNARALVMVSLYEGFGLPLVEAMQWGIPLIASKNSSVGEVAGDAGLLVDPLDTDAISRALTLVTEDEATRKELALRSESRGRQFSWRKAASEIMALMENAPHRN